MRRVWTATALLLLAACEDQAAQAPQREPAAEPPATPSPADEPKAAQKPPRWGLLSSGEGTALALLKDDDTTVIRLFCPSRSGRLLVNVPAFRPIGSEERLSIGSEHHVAALVADSRGDARRGGVSGTGDLPDRLEGMLSGGIAASYGAQISGPHAAPPPKSVNAFLAACREGVKKPDTPAIPAGQTAAPAACLVQGDEQLRLPPLRAIGTEPFWAARIEGRCVTYSHPDDQAGTRIWARYAAQPDGGSWTGALAGQPFTLTTRAAPGCSDGMSDRRYPIAVTLTVSGEERTGCAEALR